MMTRKIKPSESSGFTLIEFILALSLLIVLITFIYSTLIHTTNVTLSLERNINRQHRTRSLFEGIIREIRSISDDSRAPLLPPPNTPSQNTVPLFFRGDNTQLGSSFTFIASEAGVYLPGRPNRSGLVQLTYRVERNPESDESLILVREEIPVIFPVQEAYEQAIIIPVSKSIADFRARFFDPVQRQWRTTWTASSSVGENGAIKSKGKVPALVELTISIVSENGPPRDYTTVIATRAIER